MAGSEPILPQVLMALGLIPAPIEAQLAAARRMGKEASLVAGVLREIGGTDPRDYRVESDLWRSDILPLGVTIDQAIRDGTW